MGQHFERRMTESFDGLENMVRLTDDALLYGETPEELQQCVEKFMNRCFEKNIQLNVDKVVYMVQEIEFGGLIINEHGFRLADELMSSIRDFPVPKTLKDFRSFHGTVNQLSQYDDKLAQKCAPLRHLLKTNYGQKFEMSELDIENFENVKKQLSSPGSLAFYTPGAPVEVFTDSACKTGFGFIVRQLQSDKKTWKPIQYGSRSLLDAETRYAPIESEF